MSLVDSLLTKEALRLAGGRKLRPVKRIRSGDVHDYQTHEIVPRTPWSLFTADGWTAEIHGRRVSAYRHGKKSFLEVSCIIGTRSIVPNFYPPTREEIMNSIERARLRPIESKPLGKNVKKAIIASLHRHQ